MKRGVTRNDSSIVRPFLVALHQLGADRIRQSVKAETGKRVPHPLLLSQDVVMRLVLPLAATECRLKMRAEKLHCVQLAPLLQRVRPENHRVPLIKMLFKPWKIPFFWRYHPRCMGAARSDVKPPVAADVRRRTRSR